MFHPTAVNVIEAEDGTKALVVSLDLLVPLSEEGTIGIAQQLLGIEPEQESTEQVNTEETPA